MARHFLALGVLASGAAALRAKVHGPDELAGPPAPMKMPKPIAWLHIRKSGTSFLNTLLHHKGLCPHWPEDISLDTWDVPEFLLHNPIFNWCYDGFSSLVESPWGCAGVGKAFDKLDGRVMGFLRQPEQRMISEYYHLQGQDGKEAKKALLEPAFLDAHAGCIVKSLTRQMDFDKPAWTGARGKYYPQEPCLRSEPPTEEEVDLAVQRVRKMAFIGLTEEWSLSICLFHAMYGGLCHPMELHNTRPNHDPKAKGHNSDYSVNVFLGSWRDRYDGPVYDEAKRIFEERLATYQVTRESCAQQCPGEALTGAQ